MDGAYAENVAVPGQNLHRLPDSMSFEEGALVEPLSSAIHPFERLELGVGGTITIVGAGPGVRPADEPAGDQDNHDSLKGKSFNDNQALYSSLQSLFS